PMGAVHIRNRIRQQRPLLCDEAMDFEVRLGDCEQVEKGYEVSLITEVRVENKLVWDDLSVMLIRKNGNGIKKAKTRDDSPAAFDASLQWPLAANKGREYAGASGDYNPIHLYPLTAKLMGFKRQIMHGMWSKSRTIAHLLPPNHTGAASASVDFKLPIFLPSTVTLLYSEDNQGAKFEMKDEAGQKPHLAGELVLNQGIC
ncbi:MAG: MaoC family dehydratase, partial [Halioglobus sp.]